MNDRQSMRTLPVAFFGMTNYDHSIDEGFEEACRAGTVGCHTARDFFGKVWWDGEQFCEEVMCLGAEVGFYRAATLQELMRVVNDLHGWE